jgi:MFS superfamily sulfate permease-like transporter/nucleotide-binding universal stress UspA family protein
MGAISEKLSNNSDCAINQSEVVQVSDTQTVWQRLVEFNTLWDSRFEDLRRSTWIQTTYRDFSAGLIVALTAIPMAMGFSMAMGLRPEQGIIAGSLACVVGRTFGGSKYQVYGPTAAFIPVIAGLVAKYGEAGGGTTHAAHGFLVLASVVAGVILMGMGAFGLGKYAKLVPNSIVVGFTAGIAVAIAASNLESVLGISDFSELLDEDAELQGGFEATLVSIFHNLNKVNLWAVSLGLLTFGLTKILLRLSIFIPAPALAIGLCTWLTSTVLSDKGIIVVRDIYGSIPTNFFVFTPPILPPISGELLFDIFYYVLAIVFVSSVESLLCSSMADRLANNRGTPFNPNKEFWGQGLVQVITPLFNGFPCTGALARTATSIKAGAVTPLAGYFKAFLKLTLAYFIADYLEMVPMACIGGILLWVASNMINISEIREVLNHNRFHALLMVYTAIMVPATDFLTGVLTALVLYFGTRAFFDEPVTAAVPAHHAKVASRTAVEASIDGKFENVLVPLALTQEDEEVVRYAKYLADIGVCQSFSFVHVASPGESIGLGSDRLEATVRSAFRDTLSRIRNCEVLKGESRLDTLVELSRRQNNDLILLGHRSETGARRSLSRRLAMITHASVWMVPAGSRAPINRLLAPIDFSTGSSDSLRQALSITKASGADGISPLHVFFDPAVLRSDEHDALTYRKEQAVYEKFMEDMNPSGIRIAPIFREGSDVADMILREAEATGSNLIVMSTRGRTVAATLLLGSVTSEVLARAGVPVLAVKHFGDSMTLSQAAISAQLWNTHDAHAN